MTKTLTPDPSPKGEGKNWKEFVEIREDGEYHCTLCMACFPVHSPERARNHLWVKHGIELEADVVVLKVHRELPEEKFEFREE